VRYLIGSAEVRLVLEVDGGDRGRSRDFGGQGCARECNQGGLDTIDIVRYFDKKTVGLDFEGMKADIKVCLAVQYGRIPQGPLGGDEFSR
jgi:hypothetical protein